MGEEFLSLKPYNFYIANWIIVRQTFPTLLVYKIFGYAVEPVTVVDRYKFGAIWITDHVECANLQ